MSLPYFPMYPTDFEADTSHLTLAEDGAYNRLLRLMWLSPGCSLPDDDRWIMRRMRVDKGTYDELVIPLIKEFFKREDGRVFSPRLLKEYAQSNEKHQKRVKAGKKGGRKSNPLKNNDLGQSNAKAMLKQPEPEPYYNTHTQTRAPRSNLGGLPIQVYARWNAMAERNGLDPVRTDIPAMNRAKQIMAVIRDSCGGKPELLFEAIENIPRNPHWIAQTEANFRARLDWFLSDPARITHALELTQQEKINGNYKSPRKSAGREYSESNDRAAYIAIHGTLDGYVSGQI